MSPVFKGRLIVYGIAMLTFGTTINASDHDHRKSAITVTTIDLGMMDNHSTWPTAINDSGAIVGSGFSSVSGKTVPFVWTRAHGFKKFLGDLDTQQEGAAVDINDTGQIVGFICQSEFDCSGFLWTPKRGMTDLGSFFPEQINDRGQIAGTCNDDPFSGQPGQACLWQDGVVTAIGPFGSVAFGINNHGDVVGQSGSSAFEWTLRNGLAELVGQGITSADGINNRREIIGNLCCVDPSAVDERGIVWFDRDRFRLFPIGTVLVRINDRGEIIGRRGGNPSWQAFVSTDGRHITDLGIGVPVGINNKSQIVAYRDTPEGTHVIMWVVHRRDH